MDTARLTAHEEEAIDQLIMQLEVEVTAKRLAPTQFVARTISVPLTWWDHFKERWLERWGWRVRRRSIDVLIEHRVTKVCPHLPIPGKHGSHISWTMYPSAEAVGSPDDWLGPVLANCEVYPFTAYASTEVVGISCPDRETKDFLMSRLFDLKREALGVLYGR